MLLFVFIILIGTLIIVHYPVYKSLKSTGFTNDSFIIWMFKQFF